MRPRLIAVDDHSFNVIRKDVEASASMRPRLIAVDDTSRQSQSCSNTRGFNEATADRRG